MKRLLPLLLLVATGAFAQAPLRETFPSDYKPSACAPVAESMCESYPSSQISAYAATFRGYSLRQEWADAHWDDMRNSLMPICAKAASCFTIPGNDAVFCMDLVRDEFLATCDRFPEGSSDREQCTMFAMTYYIGMGVKTKEYRQAQKCSEEHPQTGPRKMDAWMTPEQIGPDYKGTFTVNAIDAETHIPVRARVVYKGTGELQVTDAGPDATTFYPLAWKPTLTRVPNAEGHQSLVAPTITLEFPNYEPVTMTLPFAPGKMLVEMTPGTAKLKPGKNTVTISARDAATGEPVEARVMGDDRVLGDTNQPFVLELKKGSRLPEIWLTSLFDRYDDVVVVPAKK